MAEMGVFLLSETVFVTPPSHQKRHLYIVSYLINIVKFVSKSSYLVMREESAAELEQAEEEGKTVEGLKKDERSGAVRWLVYILRLAINSAKRTIGMDRSAGWLSL